MRVALAHESIEALAPGTAPLVEAEVAELAPHVPGWQRSGDAITRQFKFADFLKAITFVNHVADAAEEADHHPDIAISYNRVTLELSTHSIGGLSRNDFILAARIDALVDK